MNGATVYANIPLREVGHFLHQLEEWSDVFVVTRTEMRGCGYEVVELRSDLFPETWNHSEVGVVISDDAIERFVPVLKARN